MRHSHSSPADPQRPAHAPYVESDDVETGNDLRLAVRQPGDEPAGEVGRCHRRRVVVDPTPAQVGAGVDRHRVPRRRRAGTGSRDVASDPEQPTGEVVPIAAEVTHLAGSDQPRLGGDVLSVGCGVEMRKVPEPDDEALCVIAVEFRPRGFVTPLGARDEIVSFAAHHVMPSRRPPLDSARYPVRVSPHTVGTSVHGPSLVASAAASRASRRHSLATQRSGVHEPAGSGSRLGPGRDQPRVPTAAACRRRRSDGHRRSREFGCRSGCGGVVGTVPRRPALAGPVADLLTDEVGITLRAAVGIVAHRAGDVTLRTHHQSTLTPVVADRRTHGWSEQRPWRRK